MFHDNNRGAKEHGNRSRVLGFEPEVLWWLEADELNSERGRMALLESARAEILAASGYNVTVSESDSGYVLTIDRESELANSPIFPILTSALCATALHRLIKKSVMWSQSEPISKVLAAEGKLIFAADLKPDFRALIMSYAHDYADAVSSNARKLLANGYLVIDRRTKEPAPQPAAPEANPMADVLERVVDVLEAVTQPRVTEIERDEAGMISSVTSR